MASIAAEYRAGRLSEFFRLGPEDREAAAASKRPELDRLALAEALRSYHRDLGTLGPEIEGLLQQLQHPASRVVVTGQQAGLLGGPAYSVHKAADAILLAREWHRSEAPVIAVYWVASQDHDADEVSGTTLLDFEEELHHLRLDLPAGVPISRIPWREEWTAQVWALLDRFAAPAEHLGRVRQLLEKALQPGGSYADVFARLLHQLFARAGLLVLDPSHPALARLMQPALERELLSPLASSECIEVAAARLIQRGFEPQLHRPAGASNLFLREDDGQRRLLRVSGKGFFSSGARRYTLAELQGRLSADSGCLTPAAGLRPIIQDTLLPTLAMVVGPGELAYAAQLREVYPLHGLEQPWLWPRLSVTWLEPNVARLLRRMRASAAEVQADPDGTLGRALARERQSTALTSVRLDHLREDFSRLSQEIAALDPGLVSAVHKTQQRSLNRLKRLQALAAHALARHENERSGQLTRLQQHLLPRGIPQEREMNFLTYLLKHGDYPLQRLLNLPAGFQGELEIA